MNCDLKKFSKAISIITYMYLRKAFIVVWWKDPSPSISMEISMVFLTFPIIIYPCLHIFHNFYSYLRRPGRRRRVHLQCERLRQHCRQLHVGQQWRYLAIDAGSQHTFASCHHFVSAKLQERGTEAAAKGEGMWNVLFVIGLWFYVFLFINVVKLSFVY